MINNVQRQRGYREVLFNVKTKKFYQNRPGDNYKQLDINLGGSGGSGDAVGINEKNSGEGSTADAGQRLKFKLTDSDVPYEVPAPAEVIDLDGHFVSRHSAMASIYQINEPLHIDTDTWNGTYQRAVGYVSAVGTSFNGLYAAE